MHGAGRLGTGQRKVPGQPPVSHEAQPDQPINNGPKNILPTRRFTRAVAAAIAVGFLAPIVPGLTAAAAAQEQPIAPEINPPGDIPDSQVFVSYSSPLGFEIQVPEGWARSDRADGAAFADKYDGADIAIAPAPAAPTADSVRQNEVPVLINAGRAVKVSSVRSVRLPAAEAVLIVYACNSEPNEVTNKQVRLENNRYIFYRAGRTATLTLYAPAGADNVDQWRLMAGSFRWK